MDGIGAATSRSTDELLRRAAEDAGLEPENHYQGAMGATFDEKKVSLETDLHRTNLGVGKKIGAMGVAKFVGAKLTDKIEAASDLAVASASRFAPALRIASAGTAIFGTITLAYELLDEAPITSESSARTSGSTNAPSRSHLHPSPLGRSRRPGPGRGANRPP